MTDIEHFKHIYTCKNYASYKHGINKYMHIYEQNYVYDAASDKNVKQFSAVFTGTIEFHKPLLKNKVIQLSTIYLKARYVPAQ